MKNLLLYIYLLGAIVLLSFQNPIEDTNACLVKVNSEWGSVCEKCVEYKGNKRVYDDTYRAYLKNTCTDAIEVKMAFKESDGSWTIFSGKVVQPNDTIIGFACKSTKGQYLKWTRKAGDNSVSFPSDAEIKEQFKD
jgi:hypothetical protein